MSSENLLKLPLAKFEDRPSLEGSFMPRAMNVKLYLKRKHDLMVGERTADEIKQKLSEFVKKKIKVVGRSIETGKKKTIHVSFKDLL